MKNPITAAPAPDLPTPPLKVSPAIDERTVEAHFPKARLGEQAQTDPLLMGLASAVRHARDDATKLADLHSAARADRSISPQVAALQVRDSALARATSASKRFDAAIAAARTTIADIQKSTHAPAAPRDAGALHMESEIRGALSRMSREERRKVVGAALESGDMAVVGAALRGPGFLTGLSDPEQADIRHRYRSKHFAAELDRMDRLSKAVEATERAGQAFIKMVQQVADDKFTNAAFAANERRENALASMKETGDAQ